VDSFTKLIYAIIISAIIYKINRIKVFDNNIYEFPYGVSFSFIVCTHNPFFLDMGEKNYDGIS